MTLELSAGRFRRSLMILIASLTALSFLTQTTLIPGIHSHAGLFRALNVNREDSIPNWYSSLGLALAAVLLALIVRELDARKETLERSRWITLAAGFTFMSIDEIAGFHEQIGRIVGRIRHFDGWLSYAWVIVALGALLMMIPYFFAFLKRMEPRMRRRFLVAGFIFVGGAVGFEMIGGRIQDQWGEDCLGYLVSVHIEEFMEMTGVVLFNSALIEYLASLRGGSPLSVRFIKD